MSFLRISHVSKQLGDTSILSDITFEQQRGQRIALAGETGSGKSTLLRIIAGLAHRDTGEVIFEGSRVEGPLEKLVPGHPGIAYLSQHFELPKFLRVEQILSYSDTVGPGKSQRVYEICQIDHLLTRKTDQLSGGERQRIALAKLLIGSPSLLLLDEPFSNLDVIHKNTLKEVIDDLSQQLDISLILVSHDADDSLPWAHTILVLRHGRIVQIGSPFETYQNPNDEYVAGLFGKYNLVNAANISRLALSGNTNLVRPENLFLSLGNAGVSSIPVTLKAIRFFGAYYEAEVETDGERYIVYIDHHPFVPGQQLFLSASPATKGSTKRVDEKY